MKFSLKRTDLALDIGLTRVRVFEAGKGVVLDVPVEDLVEEASFRDRGERLAAVCREAFSRVGARGRFVSHVRRAVFSVPHGIGELQKRVYEDAGRRAGASQVLLIESPMAAAIGAGLPVSKAKASFVVDVGASLIQAAAISYAGIVAGRETERTDKIAPERVADLVRAVISDCLAKGRCNLVDDIVERGVVLTGGGALTPGLAEDLQAALNLPVRVAEDPLLSVILGEGVVLGELDNLSLSETKPQKDGTKPKTDWASLLIFGLVILTILAQLFLLGGRIMGLVQKALR